MAKVPVVQVTLHLLQLVGPQALIDPRRELVAQGRDDVAVTVEAQLLARLKAGEKKAKVGDNLGRTTAAVNVLSTSLTAFAVERGEDAVHLAYTLNST